MKNPFALLENLHIPSYLLRLYVAGATQRSSRSIQNIRSICDQYLPGRYDLEVIDIYQQPERARQDDIVAAPTLVKHWPMPLRRLVGDLGDRKAVMSGLGVRPEQQPASE